jgi:glutamate dehydrogenase/leucine dehydrogenase
VGETPFLTSAFALRNQYSFPELSLITGKNISKGGSAGRAEATGMGVYFAARETVLRDFNLSREKTKVLADFSFAIQGFGNVGSHSALFIHQLGGGKITRIIEFVGGDNPDKQFIIIENKSGINIESLYEHVIVNKKKISEFTELGTQIIHLSEQKALRAFLASHVDFLVPAAKENQITELNAQLITAPYVLEAANGPTSAQADQILKRSNIVLIPDVMANAGGVIVSYMEYEQNISNTYLTKELVNKKLQEKFKLTFDNIYKIYRKNPDLTLREAAYIYAVSAEVKSLKLKSK